MSVNQPVLDIAYVSKDTDYNGDLQKVLGAFANPFVSATPRVALEERKRASCEHALIVIDGYALGREALELCRRLRLAGVTQPIILAWIHSTDLNRTESFAAGFACPGDGSCGMLSAMVLPRGAMDKSIFTVAH